LRGRIDDFRSRGAELVIVGNGAENFAAAFREDFALDGPLLVDPNLRAYRAAGLRRGRVELLSPRLPKNALRALRSGARQGAVQGDPWQLGGVFVIRSGGHLAYRYVSREAGDHPPVDDIVAALDADAGVVDEKARVWPGQAWLGRTLGRLVDPLIVPSFDRSGFRIHSLAFRPDDLDVDLSDRRCLITGANSGIGYETALALADLGAEVVLLCRNVEQGERAADRIREQTGNRRVPPRNGWESTRWTCSSTTRGCSRTSGSRPATGSSSPSPPTWWGPSCSRVCFARRSRNRLMGVSSGSRLAGCTPAA
jgi:hypothetical protein